MTRASVPDESELLGDLLKQVSRSFYLTVAIVPRQIRRQVGLAYLFARAADTIADTELIPPAQRLRLLQQFRAQFLGQPVDLPTIQAIEAATAPQQIETAERVLLTRLRDCVVLYESMTHEDQRRIQKVVRTLTEGMEMDLGVFSEGSPTEPVPLASVVDLDRYTYLVAGSVGEFWTELAVAHLPSLAHWSVPQMAAEGVRFGKGLQLTNVLRDIPRDLRRGRCYLPADRLAAVGLRAQDLLNPQRLVLLRPVVREFVVIALGHLDRGWLYTMAIPRLEVRLRLACMWPILFAGQTLKRVASSPHLLDPAVPVKMPRSEVYRIIVLTLVTGASGNVATAYWGRVRKQVAL